MIDRSLLQYTPPSVQLTMLKVLLALAPGVFIYAIAIDSRILINLLVATVLSIGLEAVCLTLRKKCHVRTLTDYSTAVAACLFTLCLPPSIPVHLLVIGCIVLVVLGKHLFGGLGHNPFNPAMLAYVFLLVSFPIPMTDWSSHTQSNDTVDQSTISPVKPNKGIHLYKSEWDAMSGATPLDELRALRVSEPSALNEQTTTPSSTHALNASSYSDTAARLIMQPTLIGLNIAWLLGGLFLLWQRVISWHIPVTVLTTLLILYSGTWLFTDALVPMPLTALLSGAIIFGAFFIATDPVSGAASRQGQLIFAMGLAMLCFFIREFSIYPEGFAFAVLLMNLCVPLLDHLSTGPKGSISRRNF